MTGTFSNELIFINNGIFAEKAQNFLTFFLAENLSPLNFMCTRRLESLTNNFVGLLMLSTTWPELGLLCLPEAL